MPSKIPTHRAPNQPDARKAYEQCPDRKASNALYWSKPWRKLSALVRQEEPLCRRCAASGVVTVATLTDHIIPIHVEPTLFLVRSNLQPLCKPCHNVKSEEDRQHYTAYQ